MAGSVIAGAVIRGLATSVPARSFNNLTDTTAFPKEEVRKVVAMAGVTERRVVEGDVCSTDLCHAAAEALLEAVGWERGSIDGLILVTQTPDYFMPSSSCLLHKRLGLADHCAAFDLGLGCSGYVYGLWLAAMMLGSGGLRRVLLLHGETPTRYSYESDRAVSLLFGDAGSATAVEAAGGSDAAPWYFTLHTDGRGYDDLIIEGGGFRDRFCADERAHYVKMNGANVFNFTITVIPPLIAETLELAGRTERDVDYFVFHQSNRFIIKHIVGKCALPMEKVPVILDRYGNAGGPSVPLTVTQGIPDEARTRRLWLMLLGYGVGLSWGAALLPLEPGTPVRHVECAAREAITA
ncbi:MAG TPA: ketoacyl-ACP synthase III [Vicinamibacterales bacterium]|nr:ketoacyl-ACP synthase III [Vicinamibacterales bacterium]